MSCTLPSQPPIKPPPDPALTHRWPRLPLRTAANSGVDNPATLPSRVVHRRAAVKRDTHCRFDGRLLGRSPQTSPIADLPAGWLLRLVG